MRAGTLTSVWRRVPVVAFASEGRPVRVPAARVRLNAMTASTSHAAFAAKTPSVILSAPGLQGVDLHVCVVDGVVDVALGGGRSARADDFRGLFPGRVAA